MISFLSSPKAFLGIAKSIQINAINSWKAVHPDVEIILYGDSEGTDKICFDLDILQVKNIDSSPSGIPYFNAIVNHANLHAKYDIQIYLNCDILMTSGVVSIIKNVNLQKFLLIGQRIDLTEGTDLDVTQDSWRQNLVELSEQRRANFHPPTGIDYFIFKRGLWDGLLPLIIGRGGYDNALLAYCLKQNIQIIDGSYVNIAVHQYHDYGHVTGGESIVMHGDDAAMNMIIHNVKHSAPIITDSNLKILSEGFICDNDRCCKLRRFELFLRYRLNLVILSYGVRFIWRLLNSFRVYKTSPILISDVIKSID